MNNPTSMTTAVKLGRGLSLSMTSIAAGQFLMGSPPEELGREESESPVHRVRITRPFWIGTYPVTQEQWEDLMGTNPSRFRHPRNPVENVSWLDAQAFVQQLNMLHPGRFRLPTEAEWEYACRGGAKTRFCFGDSDHDLDRFAWHGANSGGHPHPVGEKEPNAYGLHDMHGNVFEWVADWAGPYPADGAIDPSGPSTGTERVLRGGCCLCPPQYCRAANRYGKVPDGSNFNIGFRVAMTVSP